MKILLLTILIGATIFMPNHNTTFTNLKACFNLSTSITITIDNKTETLTNDNNKYSSILNCFSNTIENSHEMPALGVSIHELTINEKMQGTWLEFNFEKNLIYNEMPFNSLLINIEPNSGGFNLIRKFNNRYDGRCFYLNLDNKTTLELYNLLNSIHQ